MSGPRPRLRPAFYFVRVMEELGTIVGFGDQTIYIHDRFDSVLQSDDATRGRVLDEWAGMRALWRKERQDCGCELCLVEVQGTRELL